jgi:tetratricopeptide (TPR) repeat protein
MLLLYGDAALGTPIPTLEWALQRTTTSGFWEVLGLEHVRLSVAQDESQAGTAWLQALEQLADTPALAAVVESSALKRSDWVLLEAQAQKRLAANEAISDVARQALGFTQAWSLERQGRLEAASEAFDSLLEHAGPWAGLVAEVARAAGDDVTEGRALTAEADARPAGPWRAASLVARAQLAQRAGDEIVARAAWRAALAEDPTCVPAIAALDRRARAADDLISVQDRAADEIEALERQLDDADATSAGRLIARLVTRYYRLARLLEVRLNAPALALDYHKRALGLAPDFMPALLELERIFSAQQDWSALVALYLGRAMRGEQAAADQRPWLLAAADVLRVHLADDRRAATLYLRALKVAPEDPTALRGAADALVMMGEPARAALVVGRLAAQATGAEAAALEVRAAWLHEQAADASQALAAYQRALQAVPTDCGALDGVLRLAQASGDMAPVHTLAESPEVLGALLALQVAEALMAADEVVAAADFAQRWRAAWTGDMPAAVDGSMRVLEGRAADARGDWAAVVEVLQARAAHAEVGTRTTLLARAAELQEFRLGDVTGALSSYEAVLDLDPSHVAGREGWARLGPVPSHGHAGGPWWARAGAAHDLPARAVILEAEAALTDDPREAEALRVVAGATAPGAEVVSSRAAAVAQYIEAVQAGDTASINTAAPNLAGPLAAIARWRGAAGSPEVAHEAVAALADELAAPLWSAGAHAAVAPGDAQEVQHLEAVLRLTPDDDARGQQLAEALMALEDWPRLRTLYEQQLEAAPTVARLPIARTLARLQADRFDDPGLAFVTLSTAAAEGGADVSCDLRIADYAERAGRTHDADTWFARATAHPEADDRTFVSHARALEARDDIPGAIARLEAGVATHGETKDLLERLAELRSRQRDWRGVVRALLRLVELEPEPAMQARRAMAIARILSRITGDHRRAVGWYKRAVELDPSQLGAVWHMMAEADRLPADQVPQSHIDDAIRRARSAQLAALAEHPTRVPTLKALHRLALAARDEEAARCVTEALQLVGAAEPDVRLPAMHDTTIPAFDHAMSARAHGAVEAEGIEDLAGSLFSALAEPLLDRLAKRPEGAQAPDTPMAALVQALALALGVESLEVRVGAAADGYTPRPAVLLEPARLEAPPTLGDVYTLAGRVEALRGGRGLLSAYPVPVVSALMVGLTQRFELRNTLHTAADSSAVDAAVLADVDLSAELGPHLDALLGQGGMMDVGRFAAAVAQTAQRVGLICCGSLAVALEAHCGHRPAPDALPALLDGDPSARALFLFAVDPACAGARRSLGLAGTS